MDSFRTFIDEAIAINPLFLHPGETPESAQRELDALLRMPRKQVIKTVRRIESVVVNCYRGFPYRSLERDLIDEDQDYITLSPREMQEGIIWFTNSLQHRGLELSVSPQEYAESYVGDGGFLLTYPLKCTKHYNELHYGKGETSNEAPKELVEKITHTGQGRLRNMGNAVYELPEGWMFTWQIEKHIGCQTDLTFRRDMLTEIQN